MVLGSRLRLKATSRDPPSSSTSPLTKWEIASKEVFTRGDLNMSEYIEHFLALGSYDSDTYLYKYIASFPTSG